jgi:hypothetical protein
LIGHEQALLQFAAYFEGSLNRGQVRDFHAHVGGCEDCRLRLRVMRASAPRPGFTLGADMAQEAKLQEILRRNRVITYAVLAVLVCFFILFRLKRG